MRGKRAAACGALDARFLFSLLAALQEGYDMVHPSGFGPVRLGIHGAHETCEERSHIPLGLGASEDRL